MPEETREERVSKVLQIALDMQQVKEIRIQAVRVLKLMGAVDELWAVARSVKCPFTRQAAIDSIPALGVKAGAGQGNDQEPAEAPAAKVQQEPSLYHSKESSVKKLTKPRLTTFFEYLASKTRDTTPRGTLPSIVPEAAELPSVLSREYLSGLDSSKVEVIGARRKLVPPSPPVPPTPKPGKSRGPRTSAVQTGSALKQNVVKGQVKGRIPSRVKGLDDLIGGGFSDGSVHIISGYYSGHHSTFAQQILYNHMVSKGMVAYYLVENSSQDVMDEMSVHKWNIERYVDDGSWKFIRLLPPSMENISELAEEHPMEEAILLKSSLSPLRDSLLAMLKEGRWCVIDATYLMQSYSQSEIVEILMFMLVALRRHGGVHFLLMTEGLVDEKVATAAKNTADGVLEFEKTEQGIEQGAILHIRKMRKTVLGGRSVKVTLMPSGIVAEKFASI